MTKWAQEIAKKQTRNARLMAVLPQHKDEKWVKEAQARGDVVIFVRVPWHLRFWWWIRRLFSGRKYASTRQTTDGSSGQAGAAYGAEGPSGVPGGGPEGSSDGDGGEDDLP